MGLETRNYSLGVGGGGELEGNFCTGVRPSFLNPTPIIYLIFEKNDLFIYLIEQHVYIFIYCLYTLFVVCKQSLQIGFLAEYLSKKINILKQVCQKMGPSI